MNSNSLTRLELRRYKNFYSLEQVGTEGQEILKDSSVLVVGAGGTGIAVLQYLTSAGIGNIGILDDKIIQDRDLRGQVLFGITDLGKHKTIVLREKLSKINELVNFRLHNIRLDKVNVIGFCQEYDIIVDVSDSLMHHELINDACVILMKKWIFGFSDRFESVYTVLDGKLGPTFRCFNEQFYGRILENYCATNELGIATGLTGAMITGEILKLLLNQGESMIGMVRFMELLNNIIQEDKLYLNDKNLQISNI